MPHDAPQRSEQVMWLNHALMGISAELLNDGAGVRPLIELGAVGEEHGEGLYPRDMLGSQSHDGARIESTAETHAQRHIAAQMDSYGLTEQLGDAPLGRSRRAIQPRAHHCRPR